MSVDIDEIVRGINGWECPLLTEECTHGFCKYDDPDTGRCMFEELLGKILYVMDEYKKLIQK